MDGWPRPSPAARNAPAARLTHPLALLCRLSAAACACCARTPAASSATGFASPCLGSADRAVQCSAARWSSERRRSTHSTGGQSPAWAAEAQPVRAGRMAAEYADDRRPRRIGRAGSRAAWYPLRFGACGVRPVRRGHFVRHGHPVRSRPPHEAWSELCPLLRMWHGLSAARVVLPWLDVYV
jgi:hypothetical protein